MEKAYDFTGQSLSDFSYLGDFTSNRVKATIVDEYGDPILGATARVIGTNNGVVSDFNGVFSLTNVPVNADIEIRYMGYEAKTFAVEEVPRLIILKPSVDNLDTVYITAESNTAAIPEKPLVGTIGFPKKYLLYGGIGLLLITIISFAVLNKSEPLKVKL